MLVVMSVSALLLRLSHLAVTADAAVSSAELTALSDLHTMFHGLFNFLTGDPCTNHWAHVTCSPNNTSITYGRRVLL